MLYIFAGFPGKDATAGDPQLHAGGLQHCVETVEELALLEHDPIVQYRKEGVFVAGTEETLYPVDHRLSNRCLRDGITWSWFPENWSFANGLTVHKTLASPVIKTVVHGTNLSMDQFLEAAKGPIRPSDYLA